MSDAHRRFKCVLHDEVGQYNQHQGGGRKTEGHPAQLHVIDFLDTGKRRSPGVEMGALLWMSMPVISRIQYFK